MIRSILIAAVGAVTLSGCALLSSPDPVQLYRFGGGNAGPSVATSVNPVQIRLRTVEFPQAAQGDRLLGVTGNEAAYIKGARWVSPARQLFADGLESAFAGRTGAVRLIGGRELTPVTRVLDVDVRTFETRYDTAGATPTVVIAARARLLRMPARTVVAEEVFTVSQPATENRVSAIVDAFDAANREVTGQIVTWTEANAGGAGS